MATEITPEIKALIEAAVEEATTGLKKARKAGEITPEQLAEVESERRNRVVSLTDDPCRQLCGKTQQSSLSWEKCDEGLMSQILSVEPPPFVYTNYVCMINLWKSLSLPIFKRNCWRSTMFSQKKLNNAFTTGAGDCWNIREKSTKQRLLPSGLLLKLIKGGN
ncbi:MAG: hypothetical protein Q8L60_04015 [Gammaproteobacteria bacterium]|nr:hypothetical protein [Gammaproteobacteria bacterium]MDP2139956.1 hypothetical protein [Gammaproteobacteria bacterium]MDP2347776.1 hypothetical protein [Gammaproteobacteria bacterium]